MIADGECTVGNGNRLRLS